MHRHTYRDYSLILLFIFLRTINQILFKEVAISPAISNYFDLLLAPLFYLTIASFLAQAISWILVLKRFDLSVAYPYTGFSIITIMLSGAFFYNEAITIGNILGSFIIVLGVYIISNDNKVSVQVV